MSIPQPSESTPLATSVPKQICITQLGRYFGFRAFHVWLLIVAPLAQMPAAAIASVSPYLLETIQEEFDIEDSMLSLVCTGIILGSLPGVVLCGSICDRYGRKYTIVGCLCLITSLNLLCLFIPTGQAGFLSLVGLRILQGIPYAGLLLLVTPYVIEFTSDDMRGAFAVLVGIGWSFGSIAGLLTIEVFGKHDWRLVFALAPVVPFAPGLIGMLLLPESPRWLRVMDMTEEAQRVLDGIFLSRPVMGQAYIGKAPEVTLEADNKSGPCMSLCDVCSELFGPSLLRLTLITTSTYAILAGVGNSAEFWGPRILELVSGTADVGLAVFQQCSLLSMVMMVVVALTVDTLGRRFLISAGFLMFAVTYVSFACVETLEAAKALWLVRAGLDALLWSTIVAYMTEAFPTSLRGSALGFTMVVGRLLSVAMPMLVGGLFSMVSINVLMLGFASAYFCAFLISFFIPDETAKHPTSDCRPSQLA